MLEKWQEATGNAAVRPIKAPADGNHPFAPNSTPPARIAKNAADNFARNRVENIGRNAPCLTLQSTGAWPRPGPGAR
jgi:hypothetical protein